MHEPSLPQGERGSDLLLQHCTALNLAAIPRPSAFVRLEQALGGELARLLVGALASRRGERAGIVPV
jgi:hypothetical protein